MTLPVHEKNRRILPRWRDFDETLDQRELAGEGTQVRPPLDEEYLNEKKVVWEHEKTITAAAELIGSALVYDKMAAGVEAARFVLQAQSESPLRCMAEDLLALHEGEGKSREVLLNVERSFFAEKVKNLRMATRRGPRDPIAWLDLAHAYSSLGLNDKARRPLDAATALAPSSRFIARGAARFFVHVGEAERAAKWLGSRANLELDPWILAAEIATTSLTGHTSTHARFAMKSIGRKSWSESEVTELASALGTLELEAGNTKAAKKLFRLSLMRPSDNAVAQAEWAERRGHVLLLEESAFATPRAFEASAKRNLSLGKHGRALDDAWKWLRDEPFSREPAAFGSYVASILLEDYVEAERMLEVSLVANPRDKLLLNNIAFTLASRGQIKKAEYFLGRAAGPTGDARISAVLVATAGLVAFRRGSLGEGRELYRVAIDLFERQGEGKFALMARLFLAREERLAGVLGANDALVELRARLKGSRDPDLLLLLHRLEQPL
ncbi:hypothetical protein OWM54_03690 [Myxococcus sp. MISCRS1]|uniref:hypothetical protein n=1 Tax=Myxococcus sp. MISCRS1 TaxID=2996786 RepID=UPI00226F45C4|nr:hypothetical protein [Myxococcus sp. MISCRS1]MCY0996233.1 hypothetical protein [Myxococcus sp. MISCRS1]